MIPDLKRGGAVVILTLTSITAGAHAAWGQDQARLSSIQGTPARAGQFAVPGCQSASSAFL
jgi:hypothetical protein